MIKHYFRTLKDEKLKEVDGVRAGVWTNVVAPQEVELENLVKDFGLDSAIVADARDLFEMPRFERSGNVAYFFTRYPYEDTEEDSHTAPLLVIMGESYVITVAERTVPFLNKLVDGDEIYTTQKTKFFIQIMSALTTAFNTDLVEMRHSVHKDRIRLQRIGSKDITRLVGYEHILNEMIAAIIPTNSWLQQLTNGQHMQLFTEDVELMQDLMIANSQLVDSSKMLLKTIQNIRNANESILTQKLNHTIRLLTVLTVILTVPTIISSIFGMNVPIPLAQNPNAFWAITLIILALVLAGFYYFYKKGWF